MWPNKFKILMNEEADTGSGAGAETTQQPPAPAAQPAAAPFNMDEFLAKTQQMVMSVVDQRLQGLRPPASEQTQTQQTDPVVDDDTQQYVDAQLRRALAPFAETQQRVAATLDYQNFERLCVEIGATAEEIKLIEEKYKLYSQAGLMYATAKGQRASFSRMDAAGMVLGETNIEKRRKEGGDRIRQRNNQHASLDTNGRDVAMDLPADLDALPLSDQNKRLAAVLDKTGF